jgi:hypothetical protein
MKTSVMTIANILIYKLKKVYRVGEWVAGFVELVQEQVLLQP